MPPVSHCTGIYLPAKAIGRRSRRPLVYGHYLKSSIILRLLSSGDESVHIGKLLVLRANYMFIPVYMLDTVMHLNVSRVCEIATDRLD